MNTPANSLSQFEAIHAAVSAIAAQCDGAITRDGIGFNGQDTKFGSRAAEIPVSEWTNAIASEVYDMLRTYRGQLSELGIEYDSLTNPDPDGNTIHNSGRDDARQIQYQRKNAPYVTFLNGGDYVLVHNSYPIKDTLKRAHFRFDPRRVQSKAWEADVTPLTASTILGMPEIRLDDNQRVILSAIAECEADTESVTDSFEHIRISDTPGKLIFDTPNFEVPIAVIRGIPGRKWMPQQRYNLVTAHIGLIELAEKFSLNISADAMAEIERHRAEQEMQQEIERASIAASIATETTRDILHSDKLYPFQRAGVAYALDHIGGCIIADEMGLGKTRQALITAEMSNAFPLLIVCPPSIKFVWLREIEAMLPHRTAGVYNGRLKKDEFFDMPDEIIILGYPSVESYFENLPELGGIVCDESHYIKNIKALRTKAIMRIMGRGRDDEGNLLPGKVRKVSPMRLFLTGTPVLNRPSELVAPLLALNVLTERKGMPNSVGKFLYTYCNPQAGWGGRATFKGLTPGMGEQLNNWLRMECMVRRTKAQVLTELPAKVRAPQFLMLDDRARAEYAYQEKLATERAAESRAAALVEMSHLKSAIGDIKIAQAVEWITELLENTDKSLVVFAIHRETQRGIIQALNDYDSSCKDDEAKANVTHILGAQNAKLTEEMKEKFQAKQSRVIVLSFDAAREGHTLTAASDVLFVELGWNPGTHNQAEDRCHRIGQQDSVTCYYLIAMDTIDEWLHSLIEEKRQVVNAVTDGVMADDSDESVFNEVINRLMSKHGVSKSW